MPLDLTGDVVALTRAICDIESVSGNERALADEIEQALRALPHLDVRRDGDAVVATAAGTGDGTVVIAGHIDTVPIGRKPDGAPNLPTWEQDGVVHGRGTCDMKGGVAVQLSAAAALTRPNRTVTWIFYDHEEVDDALNGLGRIARNHPDWLKADFAVLCEPTDGTVEGGCNGTLRVDVLVPGVAAHSARAWMGDNAIHKAGQVLDRLRDYQPATIHVDGLDYKESMNAVLINGGHATNVIPDRCVVTVNFRFAPSRSVQEAEAHIRDLFKGFEVTMLDLSPGARPGLDHPAAAAFVAAIGQEPKPKYGWTDVARFSALGVPAVNFGPGDPMLAHRDDESCPVDQIHACRQALIDWLS